MADEETQVTEAATETPSETAPAEQAPPVSEPESQAVALLKQCGSEEQQLAVLRMAAEREQQIKQEQEKPATPEPAKEEPTDPLDKVLARLDRIDKQNTDREAKDKKAAEDKEKVREGQVFYQTLNDTLDGDDVFSDDKEARQEHLEGYTGHYVCLTNKPANIEKSFKDYLVRQKKLISKYSSKEKQDFLHAKIEAAKSTKGETSSGTAPPKTEKPWTGRDLDTGDGAERIKRELGIIA